MGEHRKRKYPGSNIHLVQQQHHSRKRQFNITIDSKDFVDKDTKQTREFLDGLYRIGVRDKQKGEEEENSRGTKLIGLS